MEITIGVVMGIFLTYFRDFLKVKYNRKCNKNFFRSLKKID